MKKTLAKVVSSFITIGLLSLLFMLGPAEAFVLGLTVSEKSSTIGDIITFTASAEIEEGESIPISFFILEIEGKEDVICKFDTNGTIIEGCKGIEILRLSAPALGYGYGYGFQPGIFNFKITLDSSEYLIGKYNTKLIAVTPSEDIEVSGDKFFINAPVKGICSVRADEGSLTLSEEDEFDNNKLSFIIPLKKASNGNGFLTGQGDRERFMYKFKTINIIENNNDRLTILTSGDYKIDNKKRINAEAVITLNKKSKEVDIESSDFDAENMHVSLMKGCWFLSKSLKAYLLIFLYVGKKRAGRVNKKRNF